MPMIIVKLEGDNAWPELADRLTTGDLIVIREADAPIQVAMLRGGMQSGAPSVMIRIDLPDGHVVLAETSAALFVTAAAAVKGAAARDGFNL